eukprot:4050613-Pleurochrysis_carterae.AAC.2
MQQRKLVGRRHKSCRAFAAAHRLRGNERLLRSRWCRDVEERSAANDRAPARAVVLVGRRSNFVKNQQKGCRGIGGVREHLSLSGEAASI